MTTTQPLWRPWYRGRRGHHLRRQPFQQRQPLQQPLLLDQRRLPLQERERLQQPLLLDQRRLPASELRPGSKSAIARTTTGCVRVWLSTPRGCASNGGYASLVCGGPGETTTTTGTWQDG